MTNASTALLIRRPAFRSLFAAQTISLTGDGFATLAIAFAVLELTGSPAQLGVVLAARMVPLVLLVTLGGAIADRLPRRQVLVCASLARFGSQGLLAALVITGRADLVVFVACAATHGVASAFAQPAVTAYLPETVEPHQLQQANALLTVSASTVGVVGPALAGGFVAATGSGWALAVDATSFLLSAALFAGCPAPTCPRSAQRESVVADLLGGWREVRSRSWLWICILASALLQVGVLGPMLVLGPLVAERSLGGPATWGWLLAASGAGGVVGGVLALRLRLARRVWASAILPVGLAPTLILLAVPGPPWSIAVAQAIGGASISMAMTLWETAVQQHIPRLLLGRVSAYDWLGSTAMRPVGLLVAGPLAAVAGIRPILIGSAVLLIATTLTVSGLRQIRSVHDDASTVAELPADVLDPA